MNNHAINWKKNAIILALVEFEVRSMMMLVRPYIPLYLPELGVVGATDIAYWTGLLTSINFISQAIASPFWGNLADKLGRKLMVMRCVVGMGIFSLLLAFAGNVYQFLVIRFIMGAISGTNAAATTLVATNTPEKHIGYSIGLIQTGFMAGTLAGPAIGAIVAEIVGYRGSFIFSGIAILLLIPVVVFGVQEDFTPIKTKKIQKEAQRFKFTLIKEHATLYLFIFIVFMAQLCIQGNDAFISLFVKAIYQGWGLNSVVAVVFGASAGATILTTSHLGKLGDKKGNFTIISFCLAGLGICIFLQSVISNIPLLIFLRLMSGVFIGGIIPNAYTSISKLTPNESRGSILGITTSFSSLGSFSGPLVSGVIAAKLGVVYVFETLGLLLLLSVGISILLTKVSGKGYHQEIKKK